MKIILKFLLTLLILWPVYAQSQEPPPSPLGRAKHVEEKSGQRNQPSEADQYCTEQRPFVVKAIATPKGKEESDYEAYERHEKPTNERRLTWATIWLAIVTTLLAVFTAYLWTATRQLVRSAEETAKRQLRAYISSKPDFIFDFGPKQLACMRYTIENHGETPAYSVQNVAVVDILPYPLPSDFQFPPLPPLILASLTLHPREAIFGNVVARRLFTAEEISDAANNNGFRLYCFGIVQYYSFGSSRITKFCRSIEGSKNLLAVGSGGTKEEVRLNYEITSQHNEAN